MSRSKATKPDVMDVTFSRISSWLQCPMMEFYQYRAGVCGVESTTPHLPFLEGELFHYALSKWYKTQRMQRVHMENRAKKIIERFAGIEGVPVETMDDLEVKLSAMTGAAMAYKEHYKSDFDKYEVLLVEEPVEVDLGFAKFLMRLDLVLRNKETEKVILVEHKSASMVSSNNYAVLPMSVQEMIYCMGAEHVLGEKPDQLMRNYIIKTRLRRKKDKSGGRETMAQYQNRVYAQYQQEPEKKFWRPPPREITEAELEAVQVQLECIVTHMSDAPWMNFAQCAGKFGLPCGFVPACRARLVGGGEGWDDPACTGLYQLKEALHPELEETEEEKD